MLSIKGIKIGTKFIRRHSKVVETVVDVHTTLNSAGETVKIRYVTTREGPLGQLVVDYEVCRSTIALGIPLYQKGTK